MMEALVLTFSVQREEALASSLDALVGDPSARSSLVDVLSSLCPDSDLAASPEASRTRQRLLEGAARLAETLQLRRLRSLLLGRAAWLAAP